MRKEGRSFGVAHGRSFGVAHDRSFGVAHDRSFGVAHDKQDSLWGLETKEQVATVSVVGVPDWNENGIVSHAFSALGKHGTRVIAVAQAATEHSVSFCIPEDQVADTVCFLHHELGLEG